MKRYANRIMAGLAGLLLIEAVALAQKSPVDSSLYYNRVKTYVNPVLPGDHPDPALIKAGDDFYHCGSGFHFTPYLPIYHSKDMVHWQEISRVLPPSKAGWVADRPSGGVWQVAITYFYGSYWIYFSANGQWFSKADSPKGPWSQPIEVKTNPITGPLGYDNYFGVEKVNKGPGSAVTNSSVHDGWFMISGVELGKGTGSAPGVEVLVASNKGGKLEIWLDDLGNGRMIASIPVQATGSQDNWKKFSKMFTNISGRHDVFVKFSKGAMRDIYIGSIRFLKNKATFEQLPG